MLRYDKRAKQVLFNLLLFSFFLNKTVAVKADDSKEDRGGEIQISVL